MDSFESDSKSPTPKPAPTTNATAKPFSLPSKTVETKKEQPDIGEGKPAESVKSPDPKAAAAVEVKKPEKEKSVGKLQVKI